MEVIKRLALPLLVLFYVFAISFEIFFHHFILAVIDILAIAVFVCWLRPKNRK